MNLMNTNILIGDRIQAALKKRKKTQKELATLIGVSPDTLNRYIKGYRSIPAEILVEIARRLNISICYLTGFEDNDEV